MGSPPWEPQGASPLSSRHNAGASAGRSQSTTAAAARLRLIEQLQQLSRAFQR